MTRWKKELADLGFRHAVKSFGSNADGLAYCRAIFMAGKSNELADLAARSNAERWELIKRHGPKLARERLCFVHRKLRVRWAARNISERHYGQVIPWFSCDRMPLPG